MSSRKIAPALCLLAACIGLSFSGSAQSIKCSTALAQGADTAIDGIDSWDALFRFFQRFAVCDDGSISEGVSESIARLLVDRPNTLAPASNILLKHSAFIRFAVRHIDSTLNTDDLTKIANFPSSKCPVRLSYICENMRTAARKALKSGSK